MKTHLLLIALVASLASCVSRPMVVTTDPVTGAREFVYLGGQIAAEADNVIASVETPGHMKVKYAAKREDGTSVLNNYIGAWLARGVAQINGHSKDLKTTTAARSKDLKTTTDGAIKLKATDDPEHLPEIPLNPNLP